MVRQEQQEQEQRDPPAHPVSRTGQQNSFWRSFWRLVRAKTAKPALVGSRVGCLSRNTHRRKSSPPRLAAPPNRRSSTSPRLRGPRLALALPQPSKSKTRATRNQRPMFSRLRTSWLPRQRPLVRSQS
ncbi:hypothetical protein NDU88_001363 [Pleurodeles waltl]|uniref:Uncharacterized protein n=1 Tax=Pleurodeles waltl TaxID=8319 RepID=A0AAV7SZS8_PLEWA|nr:hypothetical protein NDU88_001363 [Pleurodeles waltl]